MSHRRWLAEKTKHSNAELRHDKHFNASDMHGAWTSGTNSALPIACKDRTLQ
jgi:hypothetical protein